MSAMARLFALALRNEADDNGVFRWDPAKLKLRLLPADDVDVALLLEELVRHAQVMKFDFDGRSFGTIRNFVRFQRPHKPSFWHPVPAKSCRGYELNPEYRRVRQNQPARHGNDFSGGTELPRNSDELPAGIRSGDVLTDSVLPDAQKESSEALEPPRSTKPKPCLSSGLEDEFESWWLLYPRKIAKLAACKAYARSRQKVSREALALAVRRFSEICRERDPKFIPHAATWLNAERWTDETNAHQTIDDRHSQGSRTAAQRKRSSVDSFLSAAASLTTAMGERSVAPGPHEGLQGLPAKPQSDKGRDRTSETLDGPLLKE